MSIPGDLVEIGPKSIAVVLNLVDSGSHLIDAGPIVDKSSLNSEDSGKFRPNFGQDRHGFRTKFGRCTPKDALPRAGLISSAEFPQCLVDLGQHSDEICGRRVKMAQNMLRGVCVRANFAATSGSISRDLRDEQHFLGEFWGMLSPPPPPSLGAMFVPRVVFVIWGIYQHAVLGPKFPPGSTNRAVSTELGQIWGQIRPS